MITSKNTRIILANERPKEHLLGVQLSRHSITSVVSEKSPIRSFASLHHFEETTLAAMHDQQLTFEEDMQLLFLPLTGKMQIKSAQHQNSLDVGESLLISIPSHEACMVINDYKQSDIHYLIIGFASSVRVEGIVRFSMTPDHLVPLFENVSDHGLSQVTIGQLSGRSEGEYVPSGSYTFAWVVQGAFEIQNCLLQQADGLAISGVEKIDFEALSNDAIIIFMELTS